MTNTLTTLQDFGADRIIKLKPIEGKNTVTSSGLVDNRLFTGENKLHAIMSPTSTLWSMKYESGSLPAPLKQQFTSFGKLRSFAEEYFKKRNIEIVEVVENASAS